MLCRSAIPIQSNTVSIVSKQSSLAQIDRRCAQLAAADELRFNHGAPCVLEQIMRSGAHVPAAAIEESAQLIQYWGRRLSLALCQQKLPQIAIGVLSLDAAPLSRGKTPLSDAHLGPGREKGPGAHTRNEHLRREASFDVLRAAQNQNTRPSSSFFL
jgi:hypothetical protein